MTTDANAGTSTDSGQGSADAGDKGDAGKQGGDGDNQSVLGSGDAGGEGSGGEGKQGSKQGSDGDQTVLGGAGGAELKIELPEGVNVDKTMLEGFTSAAKEAGLNSESASKVAVWYAKQIDAQNETNAKLVDEQSAKWATELKNDVDFGGEKLAESSTLARNAILRFGGQPLADALHDMGLGNHPGLCRAFARIGKAIGEDSSHVDTARGGSPDDPQSKQDASLRKLFNKSQPEEAG